MNSPESNPPPVSPVMAGANVRPKTCGLATASLVLGLFSLLVFPAIAAVICGIVALVKISKAKGALAGTGRAIAGLVLSCVGGMVAIVLISVIVFSTPASHPHRQDAYWPKVRGKPVNATQYERSRNDVIAQYVITTGRQPQQGPQLDDQLKQQAVIRMLLLKKADQMKIRVSDDTLARAIKSQPLFLNENGQFDADRYKNMMDLLNRQGINVTRFEEVMRRQMLIQQLQTQVTSAAKVTPEEVDRIHTALHGRLTVELVEFNATNFLNAVSANDDEIKTFYEHNRESFRLPKRVKVRYTKFATEDRAAEFALKCEPEQGAASKIDFVKIATGLGATVKETEYFAATGEAEGIPVVPLFRKVAFTLNAATPCSDPFACDDGYCVLQWLDSKPSEIAPLEEVRDKAAYRLRQERAHDVALREGVTALARVKQAVASGKSFTDVCAEQHLVPVTIGPFSLSDESAHPAVRHMGRSLVDSYVVFALANGIPMPDDFKPDAMAIHAISEFIRTPDGGLFFQLKDRQAPNPVDAETKKQQLAQQILNKRRQTMFADWVNKLTREEQVDFGRMCSPPSVPDEEPQPDAPATAVVP